MPQLAELLALKPGMIVADVGAGGGAMSVILAKWLGPGGRVYATDIRAEQLAEIRAAVEENGLSPRNHRFPSRPWLDRPGGRAERSRRSRIPASMVLAEATGAGFRHPRTMPRWPPDDDRNRRFLVMFEKP